MEKPISVGDLVMVVRGPHCCGVPMQLGMTFKVTSIFHYEDNGCRYCGRVRQGLVADSDLPNVYFLSRLKRIPPEGELDGVSEDARRPTPEEFGKKLDEAIKWLKSPV